jgi:rod shape-determining protein MreB
VELPSSSAERAGAGQVYLIEESKAASIGAGLPISEPLANMICDIGGGTTDVAILSLGGVVAAKSVRVAGDAMDLAIIEYVRQRYSMRIGAPSAEQLKLAIGSAFPLETELTAEIRGLDTISGIPRRSTITSEEVREALHAPLESILNCIKQAIEQCHPELVADLSDTGLVLTGGGALLRGIDALLREQLGIAVRVAEDPLTTVARGTAICLEHFRQWRDSFESDD